MGVWMRTPLIFGWIVVGRAQQMFGKLPPADQFPDIPGDGSAGHPELPGQGGNVWLFGAFRQELPQFMLPGDSFDRSADKFRPVDSPGSFQGFQLPDDLLFAAFLQRGGDSPLQFIEIDRFGEAVMSASRTLQRAELIRNLHGAGDDDHRNEMNDFLQFTQGVDSLLAVLEDMIEDDQVRQFRSQVFQRLGNGDNPMQAVLAQSFLVELMLKIVVLNDQDARGLHGLSEMGSCLAVSRRSLERRGKRPFLCRVLN